MPLCCCASLRPNGAGTHLVDQDSAIGPGSFRNLARHAQYARDSDDEASSHWNRSRSAGASQTVPCNVLLGICLALVLAAGISYWAWPKGKPHPRPALPSLPGLPPAPPAPQTPTVRSSTWWLCAGPGRCGERRLLQWSSSPATLASQVLDLSVLPGVPAAAWAPVATRWRATPPHFKGTAVGLPEVASFMRDLLISDPFATGNQVPYLDLRAPGGEGLVVAVTQRQLAFIVANALMGNGIPGGDGLSAALTRCSKLAGKTGGFLYSLLSFLAVLSQELAPGAQGSLLVAATPRARDEAWRRRLGNHSLAQPKLCSRTPQGGTDCGQPDFMAGGTEFQALTDIAGGVVGGGARLCDVAFSQDESLVQFYSEVLAFAFFAGSEGQGDSGMLPVPWVLLGARRYMRDIVGESSSGPPFKGSCGLIRGTDWLNEEILTKTVGTSVGGSSATLAASAFVAVASACTQCAAKDACNAAAYVNNRCDAQRRHLDEDISRWYQVYEPTMYEISVQQAFRTIIRRIGTGPWGAGVWYGDSQQYFLAVWLATALLGGTALDYYLYDHFCENPGNQCFVLGVAGCAACVASSQSNTGVQAAACGVRSVGDMVAKFGGQPAQALYQALVNVPGPPRQVFDLLGGP